MNAGRYLPSAQFVTIVAALFLSATLVYGAQYITHRDALSAQVQVAQQQQQNDDWQKILDDIQAQNAGSAILPIDPQAVSKFLAEAQSPNVTETVGKTLFINLSSAKSQGLGDDIPTQDQIIAAATAQVNSLQSAKLYGRADLAVVADSSPAMRNYANEMMQTFSAYPAANQQNTFIAIGGAVDTLDATKLKALGPIKDGYEALTEALARVPVPEKLAPLHLVIVNDFVRITASYNDMANMINDPLRGLAGFQNYQKYLNEVGRVFTQVAGSLNKDGILFNKDEPGSAWSAFVSQQQ